MLSAAVGCFALAVLAVAADKSVAVKNGLNFYKPTGALSGVTSVAILLWFVTWTGLEWRWRKREIPIKPVTVAALLLLAFSILLTFPPIGDLL